MTPPNARAAKTPPKPAALGALAKALAGAQKRCRPADKDSRNRHHGYDYASAEEIVTTARAALDDSGLALAPTGMSVHSEGPRPELRCTWLLMHESGESLPMESAWPIVEEKGRPLDKATAIAATASLSYLLRSLLLMPRIKSDDDMDRRDDTRHQPGATPTATQALTGPTIPEGAVSQAPPPAGPRCGAELLKEALALKGQLGMSDQVWLTSLRKRGVERFDDLPSEAAQVIIQALRKRLAEAPGPDGLPANGTAAATGGAAQTFRG